MDHAWVGLDLSRKAEYLEELVRLSAKARREGLLSLEEDLELFPDFMKTGLQLVIDGTEGDLVRYICRMRISSEMALFRKQLDFISDLFEQPNLDVDLVLKAYSVFDSIEDDPQWYPLYKLVKQEGTLLEAMSNEPRLWVPHLIFVQYLELLFNSEDDALFSDSDPKVPFIVGLSRTKKETVADALESLLVCILEGILSIQAGDNPRIVDAKLQAAYGELDTDYEADFRCSCENYSSSDDNMLSKEEIDQLLQGNFGLDNKHSTNPKSKFTVEDFSVIFQRVSNRGVQRILRECDSKDLSLALKNADDELLQVFERNMSGRSWTMLSEAMRFMGPVRLVDVKEARSKLMSIVNGLVEAGEIILD